MYHAYMHIHIYIYIYIYTIPCFGEGRGKLRLRRRRTRCGRSAGFRHATGFAELLHRRYTSQDLLITLVSQYVVRNDSSEPFGFVCAWEPIQNTL